MNLSRIRDLLARAVDCLDGSSSSGGDDQSVLTSWSQLPNITSRSKKMQETHYTIPLVLSRVNTMAYLILVVEVWEKERL